MNIFNFFSTLESMKLCVLPLLTNIVTLVCLIWPNTLRVWGGQIPVIVATERISGMLASSFQSSSISESMSEESASLDSSSILSHVLCFFHNNIFLFLHLCARRQLGELHLQHGLPSFLPFILMWGGI